jgi:hypothetical protein
MAENIDFRVKNGLAVTTTATIESTLNSVSTDTGALTVAGGAGIGGNLNVGGDVSVQSNLDVTGNVELLSTTSSTDSETGALTVAGGVGIGENLNVAGTVIIENSTEATSTNSGALQVVGGVGVGGDFWVGGTIYGSILGNISTATNLGQGAAGQIPYQESFGNTNFFGPGNVGDLIISGGTGSPQFVGTTTVTVGKSTTATNLDFGSTGSIPYQTNTGLTDFVSIGSPTDVFVVNGAGTAPSWASTSSIVVGKSTTSTNSINGIITNDLASTTPQFLTFVSTSTGPTGLKTAATAGLSYIPSSGNFGVGLNNPTTKLEVTGSVQLNGITTVTNVTTATSTLTGALQVKGGLGIYNLYANQAHYDNFIEFTPQSYTAAPPYREGRMYYDSDVKSLVIYGASSDVDIAVGEREWVRARNNSGAPILKGKPVYVTGVYVAGHPINGRQPTIAIADASDINKKDVLGIAGETIADGSHGYVIIRGYVDGLNTSALVSGQRFHLGYVTPGDLVSISPEYPNYPTDIGICLTQDATSGTIYVNIVDHTFERIRVTGSGYVDGDWTVGGNLNILGEANKTLVANLEVSDQFVYLGAGDTVITSFTGSGLNDAVFKGHFQGNTTTSFYVKIDSTGTTDTFAWSTNSFVTTVASGVSITTGVQTLQDGIGIQFESQSGHTLNNLWTGTGLLKNLDFGIIGNYSAPGVPYTHAGVFRDASDEEFKFFKTYTPEISGTIDTSNPSFALGNLTINRATSNYSRIISNANATNALDGALSVTGGAGISQDLYVGGNVFVTGAINATVNGTITTATNLSAGTTGAIPYQTGPGVTTFLPIGTANFVLVSTGSAPTWRVGTTISVGTATNIAAGTSGQVPYQTAPGVTSFYGPGTAGQFLQSNGTSAPSYINTGSMYVGYAVTATHLSAGTVGQIPFQTAVGRSSFFGAGTTGQLLVSAGASATGPVFTNTSSIYVGFASIADKVDTIAQTANASYFLTFVDSNNASSTDELIYTTSSLVVNPSTGNVGIGTNTPTTKLTVVGGASISGVTTVTNTTNASSTLTGALVVTGGAGIGGNLYVGQSALVSNNVTVTGDVAVNGGDLTSTAAAFNLLNTGVTTLNLAGAGTAITIGAVTGYTQIRNLTTITNTTNATSTITGALQVVGGVGVQGDIWARNIYTNAGLVGESASTATHIAGGTAGQVPYQTAPGRTSFYGPGTAGQLLVSAGASAPVYTNTASIFVGNATTVTNLRAGATGSLPYQSAANSTTFLAIGTLGYVLRSTGSAPEWTAVGDLSAGSADKIKTLSTAGASINYLTFVDSNNASGSPEDLFTTSSFVIRPSNGFVGLGTTTPITNFDLVGGARISGVTTVTNATASSSITTGALQVAGGVGIGGNTYIGGNIVVTGDAAVNGGDITSTAATFNLLNATVTTANVLGAGTAITIGAATGFTNIRNLTTLTNTTISTNTTTGALRVAGGIGVGDSIYVKNRVGFVNASNVSRVYQVYNSATDSLDTVFA